ncbi:T9SS type A sorting domain-containing protein [Salinibacter altiplanensis]|uniref:T9SS type A sorting domain-containing protein n=1 Tax=Salinibacter altiplanensis TaxID=1803181 RepID=UPI000C9FA585|nr:T9SS type A sorting domain-containing protein [Salinibacter altiplanensis]
MMLSLRPVGMGVCIGALVLLCTPATTVAQSSSWEVVDRMSFGQAAVTYQDCGLRKIDRDLFVEQYPDGMRAKAPAKQMATIEVSYSNDFPAEAQEAFQRAVEIWEMHISSSVTIRIDARWESLGERTLGAAGPSLALVDANGDDDGDTIVGFPLFDAITETDQFPGDPDVFAQFNDQRTDWHFEESPAPSGMIDFTSVVLHEIGHGLNYTDVFSHSNGTGSYGVDFNRDGQVTGNERSPGPFGRRLAEKESDGSLASLTNFSNPSENLGDALTSEQLFFADEGASVAAELGDGPVPPRMYAPSPFEEGSSIAHLDERTYSEESPNALMTPQIGAAETNRQPGPVMCGQLQDMGWPLGVGCEQYFRALFAVEVQPTDGRNGSRTLSWSEADDANIQEYIVDRQYFGGAFEEVKRVDASEVSGTSLTVEDLGLGAFAFRLRWKTADGSTAASPEEVRDTVNVQEVTTSIRDRDEQGRGTIDLSWTVPSGTRGDFVYRVERRVGRDGAFEPVATIPQEGAAGNDQTKQYTAEQQTPGRYEYRVRAQDGAGNAVTSANRESQIDFEGDVYALGPYPNPVRETASFDLTARQPQSVQVEVYNTLGEQIYAEQREVRAQEPTFLSIDASQWASGVYFLRLRGETSVGQTKKMIVVQ